jgi:hypothetical protein
MRDSNAEIGSRGGGAGDLIATILFLDICVRPCIYGACIGFWTSGQPQVYGYRNYWYQPRSPGRVVVTPGGTFITTREGHTPPLENLSIKRV